MTEQEVRELFGYNLKRIRKQQKLSQMELANGLDMHFTFISDIENGKKWVSPETIAKITTFLKVEPYQFLLPVDYKPEENPTLKSFSEELDNAFAVVKAHYFLF